MFRRYFVDAVVVRRVLRRLFDSCADDISVLEGHVGSGPVYKWFASAYRSSIVGIADDMAVGMKLGGANSPIPQVSVTIVAGPDDPFAGPEGPTELHESAESVHWDGLSEGGHLIAASHPREMWERVARALAL